MAFSPFEGKPLEQLQPEDLEVLVTESVTEGYVVEYKGEWPAAAKIAHSVASFANTLGGWYFIGVHETNRIATAIAGIEWDIRTDPVSRLRSIMSAHIDPVPVVHAAAIQVAPDRYVLVVEIPPDQETPFITKDGRIYRRVVDSSEPVPESSRHAVDALSERGRVIAAEWVEFCEDTRTFAQGQSEQAWLSIYIWPHPWDRSLRIFRPSDVAIMRAMLDGTRQQVPIVENVSANIPLQDAWPSYNSISMRQRTSNEMHWQSLTTEYFVDARAKIHIPLPYLEKNQYQDEVLGIQSEEVRNTLSELDRESYRVFRFLNIGSLVLHLASLILQYQRWLGEFVRIDQFAISFGLTSVWRSIPLIDDPGWADHANEFGVPFTLRDTYDVPETWPPMIFPNEDKMWLSVAAQVSTTLGVPHSLLDKAFAAAIMKAHQAKH